MKKSFVGFWVAGSKAFDKGKASIPDWSEGFYWSNSLGVTPYYDEKNGTAVINIPIIKKTKKGKGYGKFKKLKVTIEEIDSYKPD